MSFSAFPAVAVPARRPYHAGLAARIVRAMSRSLSVQVTRQTLSELPDAVLKDIGLARCAIDFVADALADAREEQRFPGFALVTAAAGVLASAARAGKRRVWTWNMRINERMFLRELQDCELHEMGLTSNDRCREVNKPFWRA